MPRNRRRNSEDNSAAMKPESAPPNPYQNSEPPADRPSGGRSPVTTGKSIIVYRKEVLQSPKLAIQNLNALAGIRDVISASDYRNSAVDLSQASSTHALFLPAIGVAVVSADDDQLQKLVAASGAKDSQILAVEPEYVYHAFAPTPFPYLDFMTGYRDAVNHLYDKFAAMAEKGDEDAEAEAVFRDTSQFAWGLQATKVNTSRSTGRGIKVAVLDTGIDLRHPDFRGRKIIGQSFIPRQSVQDGQSHGTHCAGTACGPMKPVSGVRRYGCAYDAELYVGKVLSDSGASSGGSVFSGMNWAVANGCQVISMSLGANVNAVSQAFEQIGRRALSAGCLIVAAAGNNAQRSIGNPGFVGQPANSPSIMAVGALDNRLGIADFSARSSSLTAAAGKIDIAAPGVSVFSSVPGGRHDSWSGTSMAAPHVAGIAAQWCQLTGRKGAALWTILTQNALSIRGNVADLGAGLVMAPQQ